MGVCRAVKYNTSPQPETANRHSRALQSLPGYDVIVGELLEHYGKISMPFRKALLLVTRVRVDPAQSALLSAHLPQAVRPVSVDGVKRHPLYRSTWGEYLSAVARISVMSDIGNSLLSSFFRSKLFSAELNLSLEKAAFEESLKKEIDATQGEDRTQVIDYSVWFEHQVDLPLFPGCPIRPGLNLSIHNAFVDYRRSFSDILLFPRSSRKHLSHETAVKMGYRRVTGQEYLRWKHQGGETIHSDMEVRQAWRYNDLTPRTYFCQGGTVFEASMYAQEVFNRLVDTFEVSHRTKRFNLDRLDVEETDDVWIYDYSSFTSNLTEQKYFVSALAEFCRGYPLYVVDVCLGVIRLDLGQYLFDYNQACNVLPRFTIGKEVLRMLSMTAQSYIHKRAGALGVYGNLAGGTVLHGLISLNISGSSSKSSVVGDDGLLVKDTREELEDGEIDEEMTSVTSIRSALRLFGIIHGLKFAILCYPSSSTSSVWTYLKRSLRRHCRSLALGPQEHVVNVAIVLGERVSTFRKGAVDSLPGVLSYLTQILNFLLRVHRDQVSITDGELATIALLLHEGYSALGLDTKGSLAGQSAVVKEVDELGNVKSRAFWVNHLVPYIPNPAVAYRLRDDPIQNLTEIHDWSNPIMIPELCLRSVARQEVLREVGCTFSHPGSKVLSLARTLGIMEKGDVRTRECLCADDFVEFRDKLQDRRYTMVWEWTVVATIPVWMEDLFDRKFPFVY
jgi:hypothetical protein